MSRELPIDLARLAEVLERHDVAYVLVGGVAALLHGASRPTSDVDILIDSSTDNVERFLGVCVELRIRNRTGVEKLDAQLAERAMQRRWYVSDVQDVFWAAQSDIGPIDVLPSMAMAHGRASFIEIAEQAEEIVVTLEPPIRVKVATVSQLIESKEAVGREKDRVVVEELRALQAKRRVTIVHTGRGMLLAKIPETAEWRTVQAQYGDYKASLGPYTIDALFEYLEIEYPGSLPFARPAVEEFLLSDATELWSSPASGDGC